MTGLAAKISEAVTAQLPRQWTLVDLDVDVAELADAWRITATALVRRCAGGGRRPRIPRTRDGPMPVQGDAGALASENNG